MAWAQMDVEINGVKANCIPQQGWHANSSFAGLANRAGCEVVPVCNKIGTESNSKNLSERSAGGRDLSNVMCCRVRLVNTSVKFLRRVHGQILRGYNVVNF